MDLLAPLIMNMIHYLAGVQETPQGMIGTFFYRTDKSTTWVRINTPISKLLRWRILNRAINNKEQLNINTPYVGHEFTTPLIGGDYNSSPFKLCVFTPTGDCDAPEHALLKAVDETTESIYDTFLDQVVAYQSAIEKDPSKFVRYELNKMTKKMENWIKIPHMVDLNLARVPVK